MCFFLHYAHDNAVARWNSLTCKSSPLNSPVHLSETLEETALIDISDSKPTVPLANVELHRMNMMEDRMYALLLLSLSKT